jgi:hypothetical protein
MSAESCRKFSIAGAALRVAAIICCHSSSHSFVTLLHDASRLFMNASVRASLLM